MRKSKVEYYKSGFLWRWRILASNGEIIAASSESFWRLKGAEKNLQLTYNALKIHFETNN